jgi:hypothetical protein
MGHTMLTEYKNIHHRETIYVLGSGATLDYLTPSFFDDKITIAVNYTGSVFGLRNYYCFSHYHIDATEEAKRNETLFAFTPLRQHGTDNEFYGAEPKVITFDTHTGRPGDTFNPFGKDKPRKPDQLIIGSSGIHGAMHLAAYMGAKFIVLVGADCGQLNGKDRVEGYVTGETPWELYEKHLRLMKQWVHDMYGTQTYSLNPFINYSLEGVQYRGTASIN